MDKYDIKILQLMQKNSRIKGVEIASSINLSVSAVMERIRRMEISGLIKAYSIQLDGKMVGQDIIAFIEINLEHPKYNENFVSKILGMDDVVECHYVAGAFDFILKIVTQNTGSLEKVLNEIKMCGGVSKTQSTVVFNSPKENAPINLNSLLSSKIEKKI